MPRRTLSAIMLVLAAGCATALPVDRASADQVRSGRPISLPPSLLNQANLPTRALAVHNRYRAQAGVPALQWDPRLALGAQAYAQEMAATGRFAHSPRAIRPGIGENLWMGTSGSYSLETMLTHWGEERNQFRPGIFPAVVTRGTWMDVAHYTQMVWRGTTHVGCALHSGRGSDYLVCRYSPSGNRDGQRVP